MTCFPIIRLNERLCNNERETRTNSSHIWPCFFCSRSNHLLSRTLDIIYVLQSLKKGWFSQNRPFVRLERLCNIYIILQIYCIFKYLSPCFFFNIIQQFFIYFSFDLHTTFPLYARYEITIFNAMRNLLVTFLMWKCIVNYPRLKYLGFMC